MRRRWIGWACAIIVAFPLCIGWPFAMPGILGVSLLLQLAASIMVARGKSPTVVGRVGWSAGLWLASAVLCAAGVFIAYASFGQSFGR